MPIIETILKSQVICIIILVFGGEAHKKGLSKKS